MYTKSLAFFLSIAVTSLCSAADGPGGLQKLSIGQSAPDFKLPGIDGKDWTLSDFEKSEVLVVYFTSNHCPVCHAQDPRFLALVAELSKRSVAVVAINPNSGDGLRLDELGYSKYDDSFEHMKPTTKFLAVAAFWMIACAPVSDDTARRIALEVMAS